MWLGIDFGTCYSSAALVLNREVLRVKDPINHSYSLPSAVYLPTIGDPVVGQAAVNKGKKHPERFQDEFKRDLGNRYPYSFGMTPDELAVVVVRYFKDEANEMLQSRGTQSVSNAVITIPATYTAQKKELMRTIAKAAGFEKIRLLEEPIAAAVYYSRNNLKHNNEKDTILVYDLGAGTFDATLIDRQGEDYAIIGVPSGLSQCGGTDFDRKIFHDFLRNCSNPLRARLERNNRTFDASQMRVFLTEQCRMLKHQLSALQQAEISIPGASIEEYSLARCDFDMMISSLVEETLECCDQLLKTSDVQWKQIDQVLMVGGSSRIPYIQKSIQQKYGQPPLRVDDPELAVSLGAALYAHKIDSENKEKMSIATNLKEVPFYDPNRIWS